MSAPRDLDELAGAKRYAPPQYRTPEDQACVDMIRRFRYASDRPTEVVINGEEVMLADQRLQHQSQFSDTRAASATLPNPIDDIASLVRSLTYGEMIGFAAELWSCRGDGIEERILPETLHRWSVTRGKEAK